MNFNDTVEDVVIWSNKKNGTYSPKSGYNWLLQNVVADGQNMSLYTWSWIWKLQLPEKYKFLFWLACHNVAPTLSMLNHRNLAPSATCSHCGLQNETFLHVVCDFTFSTLLWHHLGFTNPDFFSSMDAYDWLRKGAKGSKANTFSVGVWWSWRHRNLMCLGGET